MPDWVLFSAKSNQRGVLKLPDVKQGTPAPIGDLLPCLLHTELCHQYTIPLTTKASTLTLWGCEGAASRGATMAWLVTNSIS